MVLRHRKNPASAFISLTISIVTLLLLTSVFSSIARADNILLSDSYQEYNWNYQQILSKYPENKNGGYGIKIAIIDSGIDTTHPQLKQKQIFQRVYTADKKDTSDKLGHGTAVAGVINTIAPQSTLSSYKVIDERGGKSSDIVQAIYDAVNDGNDIINISLSVSPKPSSSEKTNTTNTLSEAIQYANNHRVKIVVAAGNQDCDLDKNNDDKDLLAGLTGVITVGATDKAGKRSSYSNFGNKVSVYEPAGDYGKDFSSTYELDYNQMVITYASSSSTMQIGHQVGLSKDYTLAVGTSIAAPEYSAELALQMSH